MLQKEQKLISWYFFSNHWKDNWEAIACSLWLMYPLITYLVIFFKQSHVQVYKMTHPMNLPYVPPSSAHFQIGIWSTKQKLFDWQFCVGLCQTIWKQWAKGFCEILKFWPLHSVRQNIAGFRRGLFTCFLGHTPYTKVWPKKQVIL